MPTILNALTGGLASGAWLMGFILSVLVGILLIILGILGMIGIYDELNAIYRKRIQKQELVKNVQSKSFEPTFIRSTDDET